MNIGKFIKERREHLGYSQEYVGNMCGVSKGTVSRWESGSIGSLKRENISALASVLQVKPEILLNTTTTISIEEPDKIPKTIREQNESEDYIAFRELVECALDATLEERQLAIRLLKSMKKSRCGK